MSITTSGGRVQRELLWVLDKRLFAFWPLTFGLWPFIDTGHDDLTFAVMVDLFAHFAALYVVVSSIQYRVVTFLSMKDDDVG